MLDKIQVYAVSKQYATQTDLHAYNMSHIHFIEFIRQGEVIL